LRYIFGTHLAAGAGRRGLRVICSRVRVAVVDVLQADFPSILGAMSDPRRVRAARVTSTRASTVLPSGLGLLKGFGT